MSRKTDTVEYVKGIIQRRINESQGSHYMQR